MNDTQWNIFDDELYIINKRWFDKWRSYVQYDYIVKHVIDEKRGVKDLSMNKMVNSGGSKPGDVTNKFLLMDSKDYYHNRFHEGDYRNQPLRDDCILNRDFFVISKAAWRLFKLEFDGLELVRYCVVKDKLGKYYRDALLPKVKVAIMRRQEKLKYPKILNLARKTTFTEMKSHVKSVFQFLSECSLQDMRLWILNEDMMLDDFIESYNQNIHENVNQTFEFPGHSLEKMLDSFIDEFKAIQTTKTIFVEVKRSSYNWIFNLDF